MFVVFQSFIIMFIYNSLLLKAISAHSDAQSVICVNVLFRHGDRTLKSTYSNDPNGKINFWPEGYGQLTNEGKLRQFELGQWLRRRYDHLLTDDYDPGVIRVRSTDVDRTLMSAQSNLAGMFPPRGAQVWEAGLTWQPIPVHTMPTGMDHVLSDALPNCPAYHNELAKVLKINKKIKKLNKRFTRLYEILNQYTERGNITTLKTIHWIYDILSTEQTRQLPLPQWAEDIFPEPLRTAAAYGLTLETFTPKLARLRSGLLIKEMLTNLLDKTHNKTSPSVHVYSAHDRTISNLLHSLGAFDLAIPPFAACLMMELRVDARGGHHVALVFRNSSTVEPHLLKVAGCSSVCPLERLVALCHPLIPNNWQEECQLPFFTTRASFITVVVSIVVILVVLIFAFAAFGCRNRSAVII